IIPGKNRDVSIDIETKGNKLGERVVTGVYLGGLDILRENEDYFLYETDGKVPYEALIKPAFEKRVSDETLIPSHNLTINFDFEADKKSKILFPYGHTLAK
ncbi:TPA: hypothetical protein I9Z16_003765, partial [Citrobacter freundii]|nr:hypothetical protein [Citrobacter freundii]